MVGTIKVMNAGGGEKQTLRGSGTGLWKRLALFLLCLASFMAVADTTIVSIALPSMRREVGFSAADAQWILNGYALAFGGFLLLLGRVGDLWGRRRLFMVGLALFAVVSLVGGLRWGLLTCVVFAASGLLLVLTYLREQKPCEGPEA